MSKEKKLALEWIPIEKRRPPEDEEEVFVLIKCEDNYIPIATYTRFIDSMNVEVEGKKYEVVAWMPVPMFTELMMRDATDEERQSVKEYIKSISEPMQNSLWN